MLLTDLYEITMAYGYWKNGVHEREAVFHLFFREQPFAGGFSVACGLQEAINYLKSFELRADECDYLETLRGNDEDRLFDREFIDYLRTIRFHCDVDAIPEGTVVFPQEPLLRVRGPILQAQLLETALLNIINFQTLIATKAARVCLATEGDPVLEFGMRRAQGVDGALAASRAAYIGGCAATSNVQAGQHYGIPVKGTHAHSWVMSFDSEEEAFSRYAGSMPNNCVFLVDTYDSVEGVRNAVRVACGLREKGHEMVGIRLDSGDLACLSIKARKILDEGGFPDARIFASNDLDEHIIRRLKTGGAKIDVWGVGTRLVTAFDQPAMGGVYKLAAIQNAQGTLRHRLKLSEEIIKISNPGVQQVRRFSAGDLFVGDMIFNEADPLEDDRLTIDPNNPGRKKRFNECSGAEDLLLPVFRTGSFVYESPAIANIRARTFEQIKKLHPGITRFSNPLEYPVGLEPALHQLRERLIRRARENGNKAVMR